MPESVSRYLVLYRVHNIRSDDSTRTTGIAIRRARGLDESKAKKRPPPNISRAVPQNSVTNQRSLLE